MFLLFAAQALRYFVDLKSPGVKQYFGAHNRALTQANDSSSLAKKVLILL